MRKYAFILALIMAMAMLIVLTACGGNGDTSTYLNGSDQNAAGQITLPIEDSELTEQPTQEDEYVMTEVVWERVGNVIFPVPAHWASFASQLEPHEGADWQFWDADFDDDQPVFRVRKLPLDGTTPTLDELLAEMLAEERIEVIASGIENIIHPIYAAIVFGINANENDWQYGMYEYDIRFVYDGWLYVVTAYYEDIRNHQYLIQAMIQGMMVGVEPTWMNNEGVFHQFDNLGFSIVLPAFWEGKYDVVEFYVEYDDDIEHRVEVYHIATQEELYALVGFEYGGRILTLGRAVGEHFTYYDPPIRAGGSIFLAQTGGYTYFVNFPSGVEHNEDPNSEAGVEFLEMIGHWEPSHWDFLVNSFKLIE